MRHRRADQRQNWNEGRGLTSWLGRLRRIGLAWQMGRTGQPGSLLAPADLRISSEQRNAALAACLVGVPTLLCLWVYVLLYKRDNLLLLYQPLVMAAILLGVVWQHLNGRSTPSAQRQTLVWSVLLYTLLVLGYRAWTPQAFDPGLNLLMALLVVMTGVVACLSLSPVLAGLTTTLILVFHSLPLFRGVFSQSLSGPPLLMEVTIALMLTSVLALVYSSSWTQIALWKSVAASQQLEYLSLTDHLTGLGNRRSLYSGIEHLMAEMNEMQMNQTAPRSSLADQGSADQDRPVPTFSIALLDIDRFKGINDSFGHASGDVVLCGVAEVLQASLRQRDLAGRWGGEEFLMVLPGLPLHLATGVAERLRARIEAAQMLPAASITASFGVTSWQPGDTLEALMSRADRAMYQAKRGGRNRVEVGTPSAQATELELEAGELVSGRSTEATGTAEGGMETSVV